MTKITYPPSTITLAWYQLRQELVPNVECYPPIQPLHPLCHLPLRWSWSSSLSSLFHYHLGHFHQTQLHDLYNHHPHHHHMGLTLLSILITLSAVAMLPHSSHTWEYKRISHHRLWISNNNEYWVCINQWDSPDPNHPEKTARQQNQNNLLETLILPMMILLPGGSLEAPCLCIA